MSAISAWSHLPAATSAAQPSAAASATNERPTRTGLRLAAFFGLASCASLRYAQLVVNPPTGRVIAAVAATTVACSLLAPSGRIPARHPLPALLGTLLVISMLALGALLLGAPARLLQPGGWPALANHVHEGVSGLRSWLWPYRGTERWSRLVILLLVPLALAVAGALAFWPSNRRAEAGGYAALAVLVAIYLAGAANTPVAAQLVQGLLLLGFVAAWVLLPRVASGDGIRAATWLATSGAAAAALMPVLSSSKPWIGYREGGEGHTGAAAFQWNQTYGPNPWPHSNLVVATVGASQPRLLRVTSLDRFDGLRFLRSSEPPGLAKRDLVDAWRGGGDDERVVVGVAGLHSPLLLGGDGVATQYRWLGGSTPAVTRSADGTLTATPTPAQGSVYVVSSYDPQPLPASLEADRRPYPRAYLPYVQFQLPAPQASAFAPADLAAQARGRPDPALLIAPSAPGRTPAEEHGLARRIEGSAYGPMYALARRLAAGAPNTYAIARRMQAYLTGSGYGYDERVPLARYPLEAFLFQQRRGYCQQFSGAMALMLRMDGIPARVGVGFKPTIFNSGDGTWTIHGSDAHSWAEVFFPGFGWIDFDPTPSVVAAPLLNSSAEVSKSTVLGLAPARHATGGHGHRRGSSAAAGGASAFPSGLLAALIGVAVAIWPAAWLIAAHLRLRRALAADPNADAATAEVRWALQRLGRARPGATLATVRSELMRSPARTTSLASRYLWQLGERRYALAPARSLRARDRRALRTAISRPHGPLAYLHAVMLMPPGLMRRAPLAGDRRSRSAAQPALSERPAPRRAPARTRRRDRAVATGRTSYRAHRQA